MTSSRPDGKDRKNILEEMRRGWSLENQLLATDGVGTMDEKANSESGHMVRPEIRGSRFVRVPVAQWARSFKQKTTMTIKI